MKTNPLAIYDAIALLEAECKRLVAEGIERGCVHQNGNGFRLVWRDGRRIRTSRIDRSEVAMYQARHQRYLKYKRLKTKIRQMEDQGRAVS